jgi:hypothetical protein
MSLSPYTLVSLNEVRSQLNIASTDTAKIAVLEGLIEQDSELIELMIGYKVLSRSYIEKYTVNPGEKYLRIKNKPIISVEKITFGTDDALTIKFISATAVSARVYTTDTGLTLNTVADTGVATVTPIAYATYPTIALVAAAINLISGWTATTKKNIPSDELNIITGLDCLNTNATLTYPGSDLNYTVEASSGLAGIISGAGSASGSGQVRLYWPVIPQVSPGLWGMGFQNIMIKYTAGVSTVPYLIKNVALKIMQIHWNMIGQNNNKDNIKIRDSLQKNIEDLLSHIRKIPVA